jgi:O-antigen/teichoic acid export membrane protein
MVLHVAAAALTFVAGALLLLHARPAGLRVPSKLEIESRSWLTAALPLSLMGGMLVINQQIGIVILGIFGTAEEVGVYKVVMQGGVLITFGMQAINSIVAPYFSRFHAQGDTRRLQAIVTASARASLLLALPFMVLFVVWGEPLLRLVFGERFGSGYVALVTLAAGYCISVAIGLANTLLNMTGFEQETARSVVVAVAANVLLTLVLTPAFGMNGTAFAAVISFTVWKVQLWIVARRRLGLDSAAIPVFARRRTA